MPPGLRTSIGRIGSNWDGVSIPCRYSVDVGDGNWICWSTFVDMVDVEWMWVDLVDDLDGKWTTCPPLRWTHWMCWGCLMD